MKRQLLPDSFWCHQNLPSLSLCMNPFGWCLEGEWRIWCRSLRVPFRRFRWRIDTPHLLSFSRRLRSAVDWHPSVWRCWSGWKELIYHFLTFRKSIWTLDSFVSNKGLSHHIKWKCSFVPKIKSITYLVLWTLWLQHCHMNFPKAKINT